MISKDNHAEQVTISRQEYDRLLQVEKDLEKTKLEQIYLANELANLKRMIFGKKSERFVENSVTDKSVAKKAKPNPVKQVSSKKSHTREPIPAHLPREEVVIEPEESTEGMQCIGQTESEYYKYIPGKLVVVKIIRPKYLNKDTGEIIIGSLPSLPIPASNAGPSVLAHIMVSKYIDHLPFYRQSKILKRDQGVYLAESTLNDWFSGSCRLLEPLYDVLKREVQNSDYLQADETPIPVLTKDKPGSTHKGYQWVYHAYHKKLVCFDYNKSRSREGPTEFLKEFSGALQTDAYSAYEMFDEKENIELLACWAHARRYFEKALDTDQQRAEYAMSKIQELYQIEREAVQEELAEEEKQKLRQKKASPILKNLYKWMSAELPKVLPKSPIGKALAYSLSLKERLERYTQNGAWLIDNNLIENSIRPVALGRKNYMFAGSHEGAQRAAMMYSFFGSCKLNGVNPWEWMNHILEVIPDHKANRLGELLPTQFKIES